MIEISFHQNVMLCLRMWEFFLLSTYNSLVFLIVKDILYISVEAIFYDDMRTKNMITL